MCLREADSAFRFGGDEFVAFLPEIGDAQHAIAVSERILKALKLPYEVTTDLSTKARVEIGVSIGGRRNAGAWRGRRGRDQERRHSHVLLERGREEPDHPLRRIAQHQGERELAHRAGHTGSLGQGRVRAALSAHSDAYGQATRRRGFDQVEARGGRTSCPRPPSYR